MSRDDRKSAWPPSWNIPTSKDTRVRVDDFSKIIASVCPSSARLNFDGFAFMSRASWKISRTFGSGVVVDLDEVFVFFTQCTSLTTTASIGIAFMILRTGAVFDSSIESKTFHSKRPSSLRGSSR